MYLVLTRDQVIDIIRENLIMKFDDEYLLYPITAMRSVTKCHKMYPSFSIYGPILSSDRNSLEPPIIKDYVFLMISVP